MKIYAFLIAALSSVLASQSQAQQTIQYSFSGVPDIDGILFRVGQMYVALGKMSGTNDARFTGTKIVQIPASGGRGCKSWKVAEVGVYWTTRTCVSMRRKGNSAYSIQVNSNFDFGKIEEGEVQVLKDYDFVRQRKISIEFSYGKGSCKAKVTSRSYQPIDGKAFVPSRTGGAGCRAS